jgi:hypothetical protein
MLFTAMRCFLPAQHSQELLPFAKRGSHILAFWFTDGHLMHHLL